MSLKWQDCELGDVITLKRGYDLPKRNRQPGRVPIVSSSGITDFHKEFKVKAPGVVTGRYGTLGEVFYIDQDFWPLNTTLYVSDFKGNNPRFISYFLRTLGFASQNAAAAVPGVNRNILHKLPVKIPPLPLQHKIAAILSAYDDLIENNTRRIAILEQMAQAIYREWFVHFRFPGHEGVKLVESDLGPVPEGWEVTTLGEVCNITMGQSPKSEFYNEIGEGLPFHQGVKDFGDRFPTDRVYCTIENRIAEAGDILFSVRAPVGRINIANKKMVIGRGLSAIRSKINRQVFTFHQLENLFQEEDTMGGGTIFKAVTKSDMYSIKFLLPKEKIIKAFEKIVVPIFKQIENLTDKNTTLRHTRDLLLPRLISGVVDVSEMEIDVVENGS